jgi:Tfp pilus assembly protein PilX
MMSGINERGFGLVVAILTVMVLFTLGTALVFVTRTDVNISKNQSLHVEAIYAAEAGLEEALHRLALPNPTMVSVNGGTMNAAIQDTVLPYDPNWRARIFLCSPGTEPPAPLGEYHTSTVQDNSSWLEYSSAADLTTALTIEHKWDDLDRDGVREAGEIVLYDEALYPPENFTSGYPVEVVSVTARSATSERTIRAEAIRYPMNANVLAALMCDNAVDVRGNVTVCGHNHSIDVPHYTMFPDCEAYEYCGPPPHSRCNESGCLIGIVTTGDVVDRRGTTDVGGYPNPMDTSSANHFYTLPEALGLTEDEVNSILAGADWQDVQNGRWQEGITYIDNEGGAEARWNNGGGSGLIYVTGDFFTEGNFMWTGLIYVEGDYRLLGTASIIGSVIVKGVSEYAFTGGDPCILYCSEAIGEGISRYLGYVTIGWKETTGL